MKQCRHNFTQWNKRHLLVIRNQSNRLQEFNRIIRYHKSQYDLAQDMQELGEIEVMTLQPILIYTFTNKYEAIEFPGVNIGNSIGGGIRDVANVGIRVIDKGTQLITDVVDKGLNIVSEPIKIIIITASIAGGIILLLVAYKYAHNNETNTNTNFTNDYKLHPHIWKHF